MHCCTVAFNRYHKERKKNWHQSLFIVKVVRACKWTWANEWICLTSEWLNLDLWWLVVINDRSCFHRHPRRVQRWHRLVVSWSCDLYTWNCYSRKKVQLKFGFLVHFYPLLMNFRWNDIKYSKTLNCIWVEMEEIDFKLIDKPNRLSHYVGFY